MIFSDVFRAALPCLALLTATVRMAAEVPASSIPPVETTTQPTGDPTVIERMPGLVAFWTFGEPAGEPRRSTGTSNPHPLTEVGAPVPRVAGGPFSGYSAELDGRQFLRIPYAETRDLNISGRDAEVSMFAVVRLRDLDVSRTIAGMWSEGKGHGDDSGTRQYALLMNMPEYGGPRKLVPHISSEGGVTRRADGSAFPWCADYAVSAREVPVDEWATLGFTYDGEWLSAYINGVLDRHELDPVAHHRTDPYFTREGPAGGSRGLNPYYHGRGIFAYDPAQHAATKPMGGSDFLVGARFAGGSVFPEGAATRGRFGGLAVFNRALSEAEMKRLHDAANLPALRQHDSNSGVNAAAIVPRPVLTVRTDREDALYRRGETVTFLVRLEQDGLPVEPGEIEWTISTDGVEPKRSGVAQLEQGEAVLAGSLDVPGFLQCAATYRMTDETLTALAGAGIDPLEIERSAPMPEDFAAFWAEKLAALAAVPIAARLTPVESPRPGVETFDVRADCIGAPVSGYYARPAAARPRSLPAILTVQGAGVRSALLRAPAGWAQEGALAMDINAHGLPNGRDDAFYADLAAGELNDYRRRGRDSRETIYFLGMFLRVIRALDFLTAQPEWDGRTLVVFGASQGGAQALAAAGLDERVTFFVAGVPAMCDHTGALADRVAGWPKFIPIGEPTPPEVVTAVSYYDGVNFAALARAPGFFTVGFIDVICPPTSVYAAYNALRSTKTIFTHPAAGHAGTPAAGEAMRSAVLQHFAERAVARR